MQASKPCACWLPGMLALHEGHCCFRDGFLDDGTPEGRLVCGHYDEGMTMRSNTIREVV